MVRNKFIALIAILQMVVLASAQMSLPWIQVNGDEPVQTIKDNHKLRIAIEAVSDSEYSYEIFLQNVIDGSEKLVASGNRPIQDTADAFDVVVPLGESGSQIPPSTYKVVVRLTNANKEQFSRYWWDKFKSDPNYGVLKIIQKSDTQASFDLGDESSRESVIEYCKEYRKQLEGTYENNVNLGLYTEEQQTKAMDAINKISETYCNELLRLRHMELVKGELGSYSLLSSENTVEVTGSVERKLIEEANSLGDNQAMKESLKRIVDRMKAGESLTQICLGKDTNSKMESGCLLASISAYIEQEKNGAENMDRSPEEDAILKVIAAKQKNTQFQIALSLRNNIKMAPPSAAAAVLNTAESISEDAIKFAAMIEAEKYAGWSFSACWKGLKDSVGDTLTKLGFFMIASFLALNMVLAAATANVGNGILLIILTAVGLLLKGGTAVMGIVGIASSFRSIWKANPDKKGARFFCGLAGVAVLTALAIFGTKAAWKGSEKVSGIKQDIGSLMQMMKNGGIRVGGEFSNIGKQMALAAEKDPKALSIGNEIKTSSQLSNEAKAAMQASEGINNDMKAINAKKVASPKKVTGTKPMAAADEQAVFRETNIVNKAKAGKAPAKTIEINGETIPRTRNAIDLEIDKISTRLSPIKSNAEIIGKKPSQSVLAALENNLAAIEESIKGSNAYKQQITKIRQLRSTINTLRDAKQNVRGVNQIADLIENDQNA